MSELKSLEELLLEAKREREENVYYNMIYLLKNYCTFTGKDESVVKAQMTICDYLELYKVSQGNSNFNESKEKTR